MATVVRGPQGELKFKLGKRKEQKEILLRLPIALHARLLMAVSHAVRSAPPHTPVPSLNSVLVGIIADWSETQMADQASPALKRGRVK